jgi:arabinogalactan endo-1,4-beta-galactosidase
MVTSFNTKKTQVYGITRQVGNQWQNCSNGSIKQKLRKIGNEDISEIVWKRFVNVKARNFRIHGPIILEHAMDGLKVSENGIRLCLIKPVVNFVMVRKL